MKRKQIVVLGLVLVIISIGILQYNYKDSGEASKLDSLDDLALTQGADLEDIPGAAVYVDGETNDTAKDVIAQAGQSSGYFAEARLERDKARSKQKEELKSIIDAADGTVSASLSMTSAEASEQLMAVIKRSETEAAIETLVKQRGFLDALVYMSDTGNVDVIVKAESLSAKEVAQISDIVLRQADVQMENITVKNN